MSKKIVWKREERNINDLLPYDQNPRRITEKEFKKLTKSLDTYGLCQPIVIQPSGEIIGGHQRLRVLKELGHEVVSVEVPDRPLSNSEFRNLALMLNKTGGEFDFDALSSNFEIEELVEAGFDYQDLGMDLPPDNAKDEEKQKPCKLTATFQSVEDLQEAESQLSPIIESFKGAFYKIKMS